MQAIFAIVQLLPRFRRRHILMGAGVVSLALYPAWIAVPGIVPRFLLGALLSLFLAFFWPIGRAQLLASAPGRAGTTGVLAALSGTLLWVPVAGFLGMFAFAITLRE